ncbi:hypothetical protein V5O48_004899 [Marasmius crinis-equi]|uniref:Nephrocystin 3-like N-terminal domain-containing protein n=1 Tax=Marasmius crinis-equi TaxID=585013 RepID=A0ABR3FPI5_9AGAR
MASNHNHGRDQNIAYSGGVINIHNAPSESVLQKLSKHASFSALHNSEARGPRSGVHEGTREALIAMLNEWISNPTRRGRMYWIRGGAGTGKSAVAQTICEKYRGRGGLLAGCYFFSRNDNLRNTMGGFVPTIAYQLVKSHGVDSRLASEVGDVLEADPSIMEADWEEQFARLICGPCASVGAELWTKGTTPRLIVIDGLDECMDQDPRTKEIDRRPGRRDGQRRLLSMIRNATSTQPPLPLRFLIFSRPEHAISTFFRSHTFIPSLEQFDMRELRSEADADIEKYLRHEFAEFLELYPNAGLGESWPGEDAIDQLVLDADGHFVYVVTAVRYITGDDPNVLRPQDRLDVVLRTPQISAYADLSTMDQLYHHVLQPCLDLGGQILLPILQLIISPHRDVDIRDIPPTFSPQGGLRCRSRHAIAKLLNLDSSQVFGVVSRLRSVLYVPEDERREDVTVLHASFSDFLTDERRALHFHVEPLRDRVYFGMLAQCLLPILNGMTRRYAAGEGMPNEVSNFEMYAVDVWPFVGVVFDVVGDSEYHGKLVEEYVPSGELIGAMNEFNVYQYINMLIDRDYMHDIYRVLPRLIERRAPWAMHVCTAVLFQNIPCIRELFLRCSRDTELTSGRIFSLPYPTRFRSELSPFVNNHQSLFEDGWLVSIPPKSCTPNTLSQLALLILVVCMPLPSLSASYDEEFLNFLLLPRDPRDTDDNSESDTHVSFTNLPRGTVREGVQWFISCQKGKALVDGARELGRILGPTSGKGLDSARSKREISPFTTRNFVGLDDWNDRILELIADPESSRKGGDASDSEKEVEADLEKNLKANRITHLVDRTRSLLNKARAGFRKAQGSQFVIYLLTLSDSNQAA